MLLKENRLKKKKDFSAVFKQGKTFKEKFLILRIRKNNQKNFRAGFVVSQKISKKAVVRNKVKRRLRQAVRTKTGEIKKGVDIVLITLPGIEEKNFLEIKEAVDKIFKKAKI
jgi:ribonuclease P protein component